MPVLNIHHAATTLLLSALVALALVASADARTYVPMTDGGFAVKPGAFAAGSGVGGGTMGLGRVRWTHWGNRSALGRGVLTYKDCDPNCPAGTYHTVRTRIRLYRARRNCVNWSGERIRRLIFTKITVRVDGRKWNSTTAVPPCS